MTERDDPSIDAPGANDRPAEAGSRPPGTRADTRILVVDDDVAVLDVACRILERAGYSVLRAEGSREALEVAGEGADGIDLLLTDVVMPEMSGRELAERLRERAPDLPVLFMSAYTEDEVILEGIRIAEVDFLAKPFSLNELVEAVREVLAAG